MRLLRLQDVQFTVDDRVFRQSRLPHLLAGIVLLAACGGVVAAHFWGDMPLGMMLASGGGLLLGALLFFASFFKSLRGTNWVLAVNPTRMLIKFRSYLNNHYPPDELQVAEIPLTEVQAVQEVRERHESKSGGKTTVWWTRSLDITLQGDGLDALQEQLAAEDQTPAKLRFRHQPVAIRTDGTLRIHWRSPQDCIRPGPAAAIRCIERG